ncbi:hypothetical protein [Microtetraspora malaysiensis]|uniref:hypothetical protein n=1 Tax=Microtetraspora malaysiensis TaxID=161358 RepID=UPI003D918C07
MPQTWCPSTRRCSTGPPAAAATRLAEVAKTGKIDEKTVAELERRIDDLAFATMLMHALGATTFRNVMAKTVRGDKTISRLQAALSKALGTASPRLDASWRKEFTSALKPQDHQALAKAIKHGAFESAFLLEVARAIDAHDRKLPAQGGTVFRDPHQDPIVDMMKALARNPAAAQDFFAQDPTALKRFLTERPTVNGKDEVGGALEAATTVFRDRDGTAQNPSRGFLSAKLASDFVKLQAERALKGGKSAVPASTTALILAAYIPDVSYVASHSGLKRRPRSQHQRCHAAAKRALGYAVPHRGRTHHHEGGLRGGSQDCPNAPGRSTTSPTRSCSNGWSSAAPAGPAPPTRTCSSTR